MDPPASALAMIVLGLHLAVIGFNILGLVAVPIGARLGWSFVRVFWWRALHLALLALVAGQALLGRACFLTLWQGELEGRAAATPLIAGLVNRMIYWPAPLWVFAVGYAGVFAYALALWRWVPPRRGR